MPPGGAVRLHRAPLGAAPSLEQLVAALDPLDRPFLLHGRWGLASDAPGDARVVVAGAEPSWVLDPEAGDPFAAAGAVPQLAGDAPPGAIGGGLVGWWGYGLARQVERTIGPQPPRPVPMPEAALGWYDDVVRRDERGAWWVEVLAPVDDDAERSLRAAGERWRARLAAASWAALPSAQVVDLAIYRGADAHRAAIRQVIDRIGAGELFQANVCLRLDGRLEGSAAGLVPRVMETTDPWYGAWLTGGGGQDVPSRPAIVSASPELFLRRRGTEVETAPIKGTAPREPQDRDAGATAARALTASAKDAAEHVMILDLMRNDLGRVCDYGSVEADLRPTAEPHAGVWHLVSRVRGRLHEGLGDEQLLRATFPPGSVTGAPKVQALEVIASVEGTARESYTGAHGIVGPAVGLELAVTIRTLETDGERAWIGAGGGIVADSDPEAELLEALGKASALAAACGARAPEAGRPGRPVPPSVPWIRSRDHRPDPALGVFTTARATPGGGARDAGLHRSRLLASARELSIPVDEGQLDAALRGSTASSPGSNPPGTEGVERIRVDLVPGGELEVTRGPLPARDEVIELVPVVVPGGLGAHKWRDRQLLAALEGRLGGVPLLLDGDGTVLEAAWAAVAWEEDGQLTTPRPDGRVLPSTALLAMGDDVRPVDGVRLEQIRHAPLLLVSAGGIRAARCRES